MKKEKKHSLQVSMAVKLCFMLSCHPVGGRLGEDLESVQRLAKVKHMHGPLQCVIDIYPDCASISIDIQLIVTKSGTRGKRTPLSLYTGPGSPLAQVGWRLDTALLPSL